MQQHAVPQAITTYKFRLVGDMTLKQFLELASGLLLAWLIFSSQLNFLFKWTLGPLVGLLGFALAFVPVEDRPLDQWLLNFGKAIFGPTQFIYKLEPKNLEVFSVNRPLPPEPMAKINQPQELEKYLQTLPHAISPFDVAEDKYLEYIHNLFGALGLAQPRKLSDDRPRPATPFKTNVRGVRVRQLLTPQMCLLPHATIFEAPVEAKVAAMPAFAKATAGKPAVSVKQQPVTLPPAPIKPPTKPQPVVTTTAPVFATGIILPHPPDKPNLIGGVTLDKAGKILANVIIEILDKTNIPVRALKSNKLGQFFIATPLSDGIYQIQAEQEDQKFAIIKLEAKGEVIPPLKIQAL